MPKLEPKAVQKELDQGKVWPVYWLYGSEQMKVRELLKRIRNAALGPETGLSALSEDSLEAAEADSVEILDAAKSPSLAGGLRFLVIKDAHALKNGEVLSELMGPPDARERLTSVCVFLSKDLDARKKFSKLLLEKAAVVPCEEVLEDQREAWVLFLAKRRGVDLSQHQVAQLAVLDPWSLDIVDQELEKYCLARESSEEDAQDVLFSSGLAVTGGSEAFLQSFFTRDLKGALEKSSLFADHPEESLPLLGLLSWNVRQLALILSGARGVKLNPYLADKLRAWSRHWNLKEILRLQQGLVELDFGIKQTPLLPIGLWSRLITEFCNYFEEGSS